MCDFQPLTSKNLDLLNQFLRGLGTGATTFRYFEKRPVDIVLGHEYAVVLVDNQVPVAYGHLEREGSTLWLGVAVAEAYQRRGFGKKMMQHLIGVAKDKGEPMITLTVDKVNHNAIQLYEDQGFVRIADKAHFYQYNYPLS